MVQLSRKRTGKNAYNARMKALALFWLLTIPAFSANTEIVGKVVSMPDDDTLTARTEDEVIKVHQSGIDTPEQKQPFGTKPKQALSE